MRKIFLLIILLSCVQLIDGQVETKFFMNGDATNQVKYINERSPLIRKIEIPSLDIQKQIIEDSLNINGLDKPYRFGKGFDLNITLDDGEWIDYENGRLWSMEFKSKNAYSINFVFEKLFLPDEAELYITNIDNTILYGPVTSKQNTKNGFFLSDLIMGEDVIIYLFEPYSKKDESQLKIKRVVHAYKDTFSSFLYGNLNGSESCNNNIACFSAYDNESKAVALVLLSNGFELCSGSLLITTDLSFRPYFLTAFHCIDTEFPRDYVLSQNEISNANNWLFKFQYKMTSCSGSTATTGITFNGATLRASWNPTDFALTELSVSPVGNSNISWLGWDRSENTPTSGAGIHHPSGDVMKISFETGQFQTSSWGGTNNHWLLSFDDGVVEHNSSGSPILDQNKRVVGQLHGNQLYNQYATYCSQPRAEYGRFNVSWNGGGTNTTRLSNWLDPISTGTMTTNTSRGPYISGNTLICSGGTTFWISYLPTGYSVNWDKGSYVTLPSNSNPIIATSNGDGTSWVAATLTSTNGTVTLPHYPVWSGKPVVSVNGPSQGTINNTYTFQANPTGSYSEATNYQWTIDPLTDCYLYPFYNNQCAITFYTPHAGYRVQARAQNSCGIGSYAMTSIFISQYFLLSPNPASEYVTITKKSTSTTNDNAIEDENTVYTIRIIDFYGGLQYSTTKSGNNFTLPISNLKDGTYIVQIINGKEVFNTQMIVKH